MNHVDKIKKLLRLARDGAATPAEAAQAMTRALDLMAQHNLDASEIDLDAETEHFVRTCIRIGARLSESRYRIANIINSAFPVRLVLHSTVSLKNWRRVHEKEIVFLGTESDVAIATYAFDFLCGALSRATKAFVEAEKKARRRMTARKRDGFIVGWCWGVASNLICRKDNTLQLGDAKAIILKRREAALNAFHREQFPNSTDLDRAKKPTNENALMAGLREGRKTQVRTPLAGTPTEQLRLN